VAARGTLHAELKKRLAAEWVKVQEKNSKYMDDLKAEEFAAMDSPSPRCAAGFCEMASRCVKARQS
jgi:hypothetical protein